MKHCNACCQGELEFVDLSAEEQCEQWECVYCGALFDLNCVEDDEELGLDGFPLDMDEETKAWLRTNR